MCAKGGNYTEKQPTPLTVYVSVWLHLTGLLHPCDYAQLVKSRQFNTDTSLFTEVFYESPYLHG